MFSIRIYQLPGWRLSSLFSRQFFTEQGRQNELFPIPLTCLFLRTFNPYSSAEQVHSPKGLTHFSPDT